MAVLKIAVLLCTVAMVTSEIGVHTDINEWAYQWYPDEAFRFTFIRPNDTITTPLYAIWETPSKLILTKTSDTDQFIITDNDGIENGQLEIKSLTADKYGVYICTVHEKANMSNVVNRTIYGINIQDVKYRSMNEKYEYNVIVAVIATAVFIVPLATACLTYKFRYEERHSSYKGNRKYRYNGEQEMQQKKSDDITDSVQASGEKGAYENPEFNNSTQL